MWITEIRLKNYRAFADEVVVKIPEGSHLLVYGENGSGKSSLFSSLNELFTCYLRGESRNFTQNIFLESRKAYEEEKENHEFEEIGIPDSEKVPFRAFNAGEVAVVLANFSVIQWTEDRRNSNNIAPVLQIGKASGFFSYKDLLPLYAGPTIVLEDDEEGDREGTFYYKLIVDTLLKHYLVDDFRTGSGQIELPLLLEEIRQKLHNEDLHEQNRLVLQIRAETAKDEFDENVLEELYKEFQVLYPQVDQEAISAIAAGDFETEYEIAQRHLKEFNDLLVALIATLFESAEGYLAKYFGYHLRFVLRMNPIEFKMSDNKTRWTSGKRIEIAIKYRQSKSLDNFREILNEAKLSALSLCLLLTAIKKYPAADDQYRVLLLDDIFTGLDMNNRLPLLRLIKEEFIEAEVAPFQVGIATHDRRWYELAKSWFEQRDVKMKAVEMYAGRSDDPKKPDEVVIIQEGLSYIEKARAYFKAKDYPSTANLLRKASEEQMRKLLPRHKRLKIDHNTGLQAPDTSLEDLEKKLIRYLEDNGFDASRLAPFGTFKKVVLNPLSHDDLEAPHYRAELEDAFMIVDYLLSIDVRPVDLPAGKKIGDFSFDFSYKDPTIEDRQIIHSIIPREEIRFVSVPDQGTKLMKCSCRYRYDGQKGVACESIDKAIDLLWEKGGYALPVNYGEAYARLKVSNRKTLADLL
jgi:energy-coupling factor transporter ATP-binding protein EcfA2